jgi:DNA-binding phage protein
VSVPLTREFKRTVRSRAQEDADFRRALLRVAVLHLLNGDLKTCKVVLRMFVNATIGFEALASATAIPVKSLMRMLGPTGNPRSSALVSIISTLQKVEGIKLNVSCQGVRS